MFQVKLNYSTNFSFYNKIVNVLYTVYIAFKCISHELLSNCVRKSLNVQNFTWKCVINSVFRFVDNYEKANVIVVVKQRVDGHSVHVMMKNVIVK